MVGVVIVWGMMVEPVRDVSVGVGAVWSAIGAAVIRHIPMVGIARHGVNSQVD